MAMGRFNWEDPYIYYCGQKSLRRNGATLIDNKRVQNALLGCIMKNDRVISVHFQGKPHIIHSNPSLYHNHWHWRSWSWPFLWRTTTWPRTNTKRHLFHHMRLECKSRKSRDIQINRQVWPWSTKWNRERLTEFCQENTLVIANNFFQQLKTGLYTSLDGQYWNQNDYVLCSQR